MKRHQTRGKSEPPSRSWLLWSGMSRSRCSGQIRRAHQVAVAFAGGAAAFVEGPDDQALAAAAVAGGENAFDVGGIFFELGFDVGARIAFDAERFEQRLFGPEKSHRQQDQLRRANFFGAGHFLRDELAFVVLLPLDLDGVHFFDLAVLVADEFLGGGEINARIGAEFRGGFFLAVIQCGKPWAIRARDCPRRAPSAACGRISICTRLLQPWRMEVPTQSVPVSPPPMTMTSLPSAEMKLPFRCWSSSALVLAVQEFHREMDSFELAAFDRQIARLWSRRCRGRRRRIP